MFLYSAVVLSALALASSTEVQQCPGRSEQSLQDKVQLTPCKKLPCRLKKGTNQHITVHITPETDLEDITNEVIAEVLGVKVPFVGVDGNSICDKMFTESGEKAECPLKAGNKYLYKDSFPILSFYPTIEVNVHWALKSPDGEIVCFEVPSKIVR
ncbi:unnamed protein product [Parnassius mnemosyne]|uniref:MD-2-related lipid-recognition domain-containing protein n=1 Tax=Parnassius mnemosyne TaxID=213953 RepID=A0AAV1KPG0_9NEOP